MLELLQQPWPWYVAGPLIGLMVPALLLVGNKALGISSSLRHVCAACVPAGIPFLTYNWRTEIWNLVFVLGIALLGVSDPKDHTTFASGWIIWSIVLYVFAFAINLAVTVPAMKRVAGGVTASTGPEGTVAAARPGGYGAIAGGSGLASLLLVAVVVLMVWKP